MEIARMTALNISLFDQNFDTALTNFLSGKKRVTPWMHTFLQFLVFLFTSCAVSMAALYAVQLGESPWFKGVIIATAVGIELAVVFFSAVIYPKWFLSLNQIIAGTLLPLLSLFTIMSFMVSQQFAQDHKVEEMAKSYTESLQSSVKELSIGEMKNRAALQITRDRIEGMLSKLGNTKGSKATAVYHYLSTLTGYSVETIVLFVRGFWSLCFVSLCIALDAYVDLRLYSPKQLDTFIKEWNREKEVIRTARALALQQEGNTPKVIDSKPLPILSRTARGEAHDTGIEGENTSRFERIKKKIQDGEVKPTVRGLKSLGMGQETAEKYLRKLKDEGVKYVNGHA